MKNTQVNNWKTKIIDITYDFHQDDLESALDRICFEANEAANQSNHQFIVLSIILLKCTKFLCMCLDETVNK